LKVALNAITLVNRIGGVIVTSSVLASSAVD
jgi:hypothetical protein